MTYRLGSALVTAGLLVVALQGCRGSTATDTASTSSSAAPSLDAVLKCGLGQTVGAFKSVNAGVVTRNTAKIYELVTQGQDVKQAIQAVYGAPLENLSQDQRLELVATLLGLSDCESVSPTFKEALHGALGLLLSTPPSDPRAGALLCPGIDPFGPSDSYRFVPDCPPSSGPSNGRAPNQGAPDQGAPNQGTPNQGTPGGTSGVPDQGGTEAPNPGGRSDDTPRIISVSTHTEGVMVYATVKYADADGDAVGFGFEGVNGSGWAPEEHTFSSPSYGRVSADGIEYPFNQNCGNASQARSDVEFWIYDDQGQRSQSASTSLVCSSPQDYYLVDRATVNPADGPPNGGLALVAGKSFPRSIWTTNYAEGAGRGDLEYDLQGHCTVLQYTAGLTDSSPSNSKERFEVYGDGRLLASSDISFGSAEAQSVEVGSVQRLQLITTLTAPVTSTAVWGDARVTCSSLD